MTIHWQLFSIKQCFFFTFAATMIFFLNVIIVQSAAPSVLIWERSCQVIVKENYKKHLTIKCEDYASDRLTDPEIVIAMKNVQLTTTCKAHESQGWFPTTTLECQ